MKNDYAYTEEEEDLLFNSKRSFKDDGSFTWGIRVLQDIQKQDVCVVNGPLTDIHIESYIANHALTFDKEWEITLPRVNKKKIYDMRADRPNIYSTRDESLVSDYPKGLAEKYYKRVKARNNPEEAIKNAALYSTRSLNSRIVYRQTISKIVDKDKILHDLETNTSNKKKESNALHRNNEIYSRNADDNEEHPLANKKVQSNTKSILQKRPLDQNGDAIKKSKIANTEDQLSVYKTLHNNSGGPLWKGYQNVITNGSNKVPSNQKPAWLSESLRSRIQGPDS